MIFKLAVEIMLLVGMVLCAFNAGMENNEIDGCTGAFALIGLLVALCFALVHWGLV